jgi:hypothetical protein
VVKKLLKIPSFMVRKKRPPPVFEQVAPLTMTATYLPIYNARRKSGLVGIFFDKVGFQFLVNI